jgi:hypothetical protein
MSDPNAPAVVTGPVTLVLDAEQVRLLLQHLDFSVRQGGLQHARTALPLAHALELAAVRAAQPPEEHAR